MFERIDGLASASQGIAYGALLGEKQKEPFNQTLTLTASQGRDSEGFKQPQLGLRLQA